MKRNKPVISLKDCSLAAAEKCWEELKPVLPTPLPDGFEKVFKYTYANGFKEGAEMAIEALSIQKEK